MSKVDGSDSKNTLYCSFCGKSQHEVRKLIAGPTVFICDECVELCMDIIGEENKSSLVKSRDGIPTPREIRKVLNGSRLALSVGRVCGMNASKLFGLVGQATACCVARGAWLRCNRLLTGLKDSACPSTPSCLPKTRSISPPSAI
jgi:hypothetical protein